MGAEEARREGSPMHGDTPSVHPGAASMSADESDMEFLKLLMGAEFSDVEDSDFDGECLGKLF